MKPLFYLVTLFLASLIVGCSTPQVKTIQTTNHKRGHLLKFQVNGQETKFTGERDIFDSNRISANTTYWEVESSGKLCFKINADLSLGEFKSSSFVLKEIRENLPYTRWKNYSFSPEAPGSYFGQKTWAPGEEYCPKEYILTPRLKYPKLPPGDYVLIVYFNGKTLWASQEVFLKIKE